MILIASRARPAMSHSTLHSWDASAILVWRAPKERTAKLRVRAVVRAVPRVFIAQHMRRIRFRGASLARMDSSASIRDRGGAFRVTHRVTTVHRGHRCLY